MKRDPWPGVPERYDDTYYATSDAGWEVMFAWDDNFDQFVTLVHPDYGAREIHDPDEVDKITKLMYEGGLYNGIAIRKSFL